MLQGSIAAEGSKFLKIQRLNASLSRVFAFDQDHSAASAPEVQIDLARWY